MDTQDTNPLPGNAFATQERWLGWPDPIKAAALGQPRPDWKACLQLLQPELAAIVRHIQTAPLLLGEKDELACAVAAYFFGVTAVISRKNFQLNAREIADLIVEHIREKPTLTLIEKCQVSN
jgi:hypothetical protein